MEKFKECPTCAAKPGMPVLCESCLYNRKTMNELERQVEDLRNEIQSVEDKYHLNKIKDEVIAHLRGEDATLSPRNMVHAMFTLNYADWLGSVKTEPTCNYER